MTDPTPTPDAPAPDLRARLLAILEKPMIADWKADRILEIAVPRGGPGPGWHVKELRKFAAGWTGEIPGPGSLAGLAADQIEMLDRRIDELAALRAERDEAQPAAPDLAEDAWNAALKVRTEPFELATMILTRARLAAIIRTVQSAHPPATSPGAAGDAQQRLDRIGRWLGEQIKDCPDSRCVPDDMVALAALIGLPISETQDILADPAPAAAEVDRVRALERAMHEAKGLLSYAGQDSVDPAIAQANKNRAWHVLNEALRSAAP